MEYICKLKDSMMAQTEKEILLGKNPEEIKALCQNLGFPAFTARQITEWLYKKRCSDIDRMSNLSLHNREKLKAIALTGISAPLQMQESQDGTRKYLFSTYTGQNQTAKYIESVFIPDGERATLCVSCQSGCRMNCAFCATGSQGFNHHLQAHEILNQLHGIPETDQLSNVVFMGMGEPFDNIDNVLRALSVITADWGWAWSPSRITVSTVGIIPQTQRFLNESLCHLAISLHHPFSEERARLMPVEKTYPVKELINLLRTYNWHGQRRLSFEYILIDGENDTPRHALATARLLAGLECRVNLIACHEVPGKPYRKSSRQTIENFQKTLQGKGIVCTLRKSRGEDIMAACGLLAKTRQK